MVLADPQPRTPRVCTAPFVSRSSLLLALLVDLLSITIDRRSPFTYQLRGTRAGLNSVCTGAPQEELLVHIHLLAPQLLHWKPWRCHLDIGPF